MLLMIFLKAWKYCGYVLYVNIVVQGKALHMIMMEIPLRVRMVVTVLFVRNAGSWPL